MIKELFEKQRASLDYFFRHIDLHQAQAFMDELVCCQGVIFFCGVGKSGLIAEKIATTMTSIGTRAMFISPMNAVHGDLGIVSARDLFVMISKSGESEELLHLIPSLRNRSIKIASLVCQPRSRLAKASDIFIHLPIDKELCSFDLVPTISTAVQMMFGDVLAVGMMHLKNFNLDQYALNHPAGRIGKRITLKVADLMVRDQAIPFCYPQDTLIDVLVELSDKKCGCILVIDPAKHLLGIFTDGDLRRSLQNFGSEALKMKMESLMVATKRIISSERMAVEAMEAMESDPNRPITILPVVDHDKVVGVIKLHDIIQSGL